MHASCQLLLSNTYRHAKMEEKENILSTLSNGANEFDLTPNSPMTVTVSPLNSTMNNKCILETTKSKPKSDVKGNMIKGRYDIKHNNTCHQNLYMYMHAVSGKKRKRCGICPNCTRPECGTCKHCRDKPKYGGPGRLKQSCEKKKCQDLTLHVGSNSQDLQPPQTTVSGILSI